ncbi:MAG: MBL fold metallo-hydrolase [Actinocatenispora sp.]
MAETGTGSGSGAWTEPGVYEVAPGVHRIPLPLPNDNLRAVNVYAVDSGDGLVLVDSGWALDEARSALESALGTLGFGFEDVRRFLVTHIHRDHYTLAVSLRRTFGSRIALGAGEKPNLDLITSGNLTSAFPDLRAWGAEPLAEPLRAAFRPSRRDRENFEPPDEWLAGTQDVPVGGRTLRAVPTPGHTQGHVVFVDEAASLLFAGDHVLPHITPSIGFEPVRGRRPLGDYLDSLRLMAKYPDLRLLPAHGPVGGRLHARVDELLAHHEDRLGETGDAVRAGAATAYDAARRITWTRRRRGFDDLDLFNQMLAVGETAAHLDVLVERGELTMAVTDGVAYYA